MLAITLAAGKGTRMNELTKDLPKTMFEFQGKPLLSYQSKLFQERNIDHYVVGGYQYKKLNMASKQVIVNQEYETTNMVYSMFLALNTLKEKIKNQDVIISYGDIIYQNNVLDALINANVESDIQVCADKNFYPYWSFRMDSPLSDLESFEIDKKNSFIKNIGQRTDAISTIEAQYIGLFKISLKYVSKLTSIYNNLVNQDKTFYKISITELFQILIQKYEVKIYPVYIKGGWLEFDSDQDVNVYNESLKNNKLDEFFNEKFDYRLYQS